jgi:hypothetical protein
MFSHLKNFTAHNFRNGFVLAFVFKHCHFLFLFLFFFLSLALPKVSLHEKLCGGVPLGERKQSAFLFGQQQAPIINIFAEGRLIESFLHLAHLPNVVLFYKLEFLLQHFHASALGLQGGVERSHQFATYQLYWIAGGFGQFESPAEIVEVDAFSNGEADGGIFHLSEDVV